MKRPACGKKPEQLPVVSYQGAKKFESLQQSFVPTSTKRELVGVDVFIYSKEPAESIIQRTSAQKWDPLPLRMIGNRGVRVWPEGHPETFCVDHPHALRPQAQRNAGGA